MTTDVAAVVTRHWHDVLQHDGTQASEDFFELGGSSVLALELAARVERDLGTPFPLEALFLQGTLQDVISACALGAEGAGSPLPT